ncbi:MAG TPA: hypothetical protein VMC85_20550 [Desulfomonilaceae bacterium]|nr:hypothetical protein [Desulfomonilaceae bacterium]
MRTLEVFLMLFVVVLVISSESFGNGVPKKSSVDTEKEILHDAYPAKQAPMKPGEAKPKGMEANCRVVYRAQKPFAATLEDGVAYMLDIPLALLTPFVAAVSRVTEELGSDCGTTYSRR